MTTIQHGTISLEIPDELAPPAKAGKLSPEEVARIPRPRRGIGLVCKQVADAIEKAGQQFTPPKDVTPDMLRAAAKRADEIDQYLIDLEVVKQTLQQANLLFDADAWEQIRKVNDQVKAQVKHDPGLVAMFQQLTDYLAHAPRTPKGDPTK